MSTDFEEMFELAPVSLWLEDYSALHALFERWRAAGITDLRYGHVVDEDWHGHDRFRRKPDSRHQVPLPDGVRCFALAATMAAKRSALADRLVGDGLVPLDSALGVHEDARRRLDFAPQNQWIAHGMNHLELLSREEVTRQLVRWLGASPSA